MRLTNLTPLKNKENDGGSSTGGHALKKQKTMSLRDQHDNKFTDRHNKLSAQDAHEIDKISKMSKNYSEADKQQNLRQPDEGSAGGNLKSSETKGDQLEQSDDDFDETQQTQTFCFCFKRKKKTGILDDDEFEEDQELDAGSDLKNATGSEISKGKQAGQSSQKIQEDFDKKMQDAVDNAPNKECYCTTEEKKKLKHNINMFSLKNTLLQQIFNKEREEVKKAFEALKKTAQSEQELKHIIMLCFWFAIHNNSFEEAQLIYKQDKIITLIMKNLRERGSMFLDQNKRQVGSDQDDESREHSAVDIQKSEMDLGKEDGEDEGDEQDLPHGVDLAYSFQSQKEMQEIKLKLMKRYDEKKSEITHGIGAPFNTNILRIALNMRETAIAQWLIIDYQVYNSEAMMIRAIKTRQIDFLYSVYAFNKNYELNMEYEGDDQQELEKQDDTTNNDVTSAKEKQKYNVFTFNWLFKNIIEYCQDDADQRIREIAKMFRLDSTENILLSLLRNRQDMVAATFGDNFRPCVTVSIINQDGEKELTCELILFAFKNQNETFLKYAFREAFEGTALYTSQIFQEQKIKEAILEILQQGYATNMILNVLVHADFSKWDQTNLKNLIDWIDTIVDPEREPEVVMKCWNPIQAICLCCEFLTKIGNAVSNFHHTSMTLKEQLLGLGEQIIAQDLMDDNLKVEKMFLEKDFLDRTVLNLISMNGYEPLMRDNKVIMLLNNLWVGKPQARCNGMMVDYSMLSFLATAPIKQLPGQNIEVKSILTNNFKENIKECFPVQYKFRQSSIEKIFQKEFLSTVFVSSVMFMINFTYLINFSVHQFKPFQKNIEFVKSYRANDTYWEMLLNQTIQPAVYNLTNHNNYRVVNRTDLGIKQEEEEAVLLERLSAKRDDYMVTNNYGQVVSICMFFYVATKSIFNHFADIQIPMDRWSVIDVFCAFSNIICLSIFTLFFTEKDILDENKKMYFNLLQLLTVFATWARITGMSLVVQRFSKLLMTIYEMLGSATTFLFIVLCYLVVMTLVALSLFQEMCPEYISIFYILRTLFDNLMGSYSYDVFSKHQADQNIHTVFLFIHIYIANIFLLNYLVAILSTVYSNMMETGEFSFLCNKYLYIERYNIAFQDKNGYSELVLYPPPINVMLVLLLPGVFKKDQMLRNARIFSQVNFWFENIYYLTQQLVWECILVPYIYLRNIIFIIKLSIFTFFGWVLLIGWTLLGPIYLIYVVFMDMFFMLKILCDYKLDDDRDELMRSEDRRQDDIVLYNEIIMVIKTILLIFMQKKAQLMNPYYLLSSLHSDMELQEAVTLQFEQILRMEKESQDIIEAYTLNKDIILEAWARFRPVQNENDDVPKTKAKRVGDIKKIFSYKFLVKMMVNMHLKLYEDKQSERELKVKKKFKDEFLQHYKLIIREEEKKIERQKMNNPGYMDTRRSNQAWYDEPSALDGIPEEEVEFIDEFLTSLVMQSDSATKIDQIDLKLALKALPTWVDENNFYRCGLLNMCQMKQALISHHNSSQEQLFKYYDNRNKSRLSKLNRKASIASDLTQSLLELGSQVNSQYQRITKGGLNREEMYQAPLIIDLPKVGDSD